MTSNVRYNESMHYDIIHVRHSERGSVISDYLVGHCEHLTENMQEINASITILL